MAFFKRKVPSDNVAAVRKTLTRRFDFLVTAAAAALNITDEIVACVVRGETPDCCRAPEYREKFALPNRLAQGSRNSIVRLAL
jgi:hypothetical protein